MPISFPDIVCSSKWARRLSDSSNMIMSYLRLKPSPLKTSSLLVKMFMRLSSWTMRRGAFQTEGSSWESR